MRNPLLDLEFLRKLDLMRNKATYAKIILLTWDENPVYEIQGKITAGSINIDGASAVRRTCSLTMVSPDVDITNTYWALKNKFKLEVGVENEIDSQYPDIIWFKQGIYVFTGLNMNVQSNNFTISLNGKDVSSELDNLENSIKNIKGFSGDYNDLTNAPNIIEDESGDLVIADNTGNVIFKVDSDGMHTTALSLNGSAAATEDYVNEAMASIDIPEVDFTGYATEEFVENTVDSMKEELSESITSESDEWKIVDEAGNIIFSVDATGAHTTSLTLNGEDVEDIIDNRVASLVDSAPDTLNTLNEFSEALNDDPNFDTTVATEIGKKVDKVDGKGLSTNDFTDEYKAKLEGLENITFEESDPTVPAWAKEPNKPTYTAEEVGALSDSTTFEDLDGRPNIEENESGDLLIVDNNGNVVFRADSDGVETTQLTVGNIIINGKSIEDMIQDYVNEAILGGAW